MYGRISVSNFSVSPNGPHTNYWNASVNVLVSTDGVNWKSGGTLVYQWDDDPEDRFISVVDFTGASERYRYIRIVLTTADPGATGGARASGQVTIQFYSVAADQETVEEARDAAIQARDNTQAAVDAARSAQTAAQQAQQAAQQAVNGVNYIQNNILSTSAGVVQDNQGTVLMEARLAKIKAMEAASAIANVQNKVDSIEAAQNQISSQLSAVQNQITNVINYLPPSLTRIKGYNGATATRTGSIRLVLECSNANEYRVKLNDGGWSGWQPIPADRTITVGGLSVPGMHTIHVEVRNKPAGYDGTSPLPTAYGSFTAYRL